MHNQFCYLQRLLKWKVYTKVIKMPGWKAWVQRPSGRKCKYILRETTLIKEENVSWKWISLININHYHLITFGIRANAFETKSHFNPLHNKLDPLKVLAGKVQQKQNTIAYCSREYELHWNILVYLMMLKIIIQQQHSGITIYYWFQVQGFNPSHQWLRERKSERERKKEREREKKKV
jgi:hypothetical protein